MCKVLVAALGSLLLIVAFVAAFADETFAQRGRAGGLRGAGGFHGAGFVSRGHVGPGVVFRGAQFSQRPWLRRGIGIGVVGVGVESGYGYSGYGDNCVFETRYVWNGLATQRDLVTVCY